MTKAEYLGKLKNEAVRVLGRKAADEILGDYKEYFESGIQDGKSEHELCTEFGDPKTVVAEVSKDAGGLRPMYAKIRSKIPDLFFRACIIIWAGISIIPPHGGSGNYPSGWVWSFIAVLILPALTLIGLRGFRFLNEPHDLRPAAAKLFIGLILFLTGFGIIYWVSMDGIYYVLNSSTMSELLARTDIDHARLGPSLFAGLFLIRVTAFSGALLCLFIGSVKSSAAAFSFIFPLTGVMMWMHGKQSALQTMSDLTAYENNMRNVFWPPVLFGAAGFLICFTVLTFTKKGKRA